MRKSDEKIIKSSTLSSFVRGGVIDPSYGLSRHLGRTSLCWSITAFLDTSIVYSLNFISTNVYSSYYNARADAFSVRCLAL